MYQPKQQNQSDLDFMLFNSTSFVQVRIKNVMKYLFEFMADHRNWLDSVSGLKQHRKTSHELDDLAIVTRVQHSSICFRRFLNVT